MKTAGGVAGEGKGETESGGAERRPPLFGQKSKKTARLEVKSALPSDRPVPT